MKTPVGLGGRVRRFGGRGPGISRGVCFPKLNRDFWSFEDFYEIPRGGRGEDFSPEPLLGRAGVRVRWHPGDNQPPQARGEPQRPLSGPTAAKLPHRAGRGRLLAYDPHPAHRPSAARRALQQPGAVSRECVSSAPRAARNCLTEHLPAAPARSPGPGGGPVAAPAWRSYAVARAQEPHSAVP